MVWTIEDIPRDAQLTLISELNIAPITARLLVMRGIATVEEARAFLWPSLRDIEDPSLLPDIDIAVERLIKAIEEKQKIVLYGDYDTDGTTSTSAMIRFLREIGHTSVEFYIPHREEEGYGLHPHAITEIAKRGCQLMITLDTGTTAVEAIDLANQKGMDVIVIDHHEMGEVLPKACAVVNPKRQSDGSSRMLAAVGVTFKVLIALRRRMQDKGILESGVPNLKQFLDLVALGTIGDVVPLIGDNRILTRFGIGVLRSTENVGIRALAEVSGADLENIHSDDIAFKLSPRINAAGRMAHARMAVELLTTDNPDQATLIAQALNDLNTKRRAIEHKIISEACAIIDEKGLSSSIVLGSHEWPAGVVGIAASRLVEKYRRPCILVGFQNGHGRGSARSIGQFPLLDGIRTNANLLEKWGGHQMAAGITVATNQFELFQRAFDAFAKKMLTSTDTEPHLAIDHELIPTDITPALIREIKMLEPFGAGNPRPLFCTRGFTVRDRRIVGNNHLKLKVNGQFITLDAIGFNMGDHPSSQKEVINAAYIPEFNTYNGITTIQLHLKDIE